MPKISVIVPVYKVEQYLDRCVQSILGQTYTDFELILVDDGSPDHCPAICDDYAKQDKRVVVIHQENGGLSAARNAGIDWAFANSDSDWLTFIDSDDWVHSEYLERLCTAVIEHNVAISVCGFERTEGEEPIIEKEKLSPVIWTAEDFYVEHNVNAVVAWGKLYRKELFKGIRYPVGKIHEDQYVTYRLLFTFDKISYISAPLYAYFQNNEGITNTSWTIKKVDAIDAFNAQRQYFKKRHYQRAHLFSVCCLADHLSSDLEHLKNTHFRSEHIRLRRMLASILLKYSKLYPFKKENLWRYEQAFPKSMRFYWMVFGVINKLKRGFCKCRK